jgi:hypothetical protein
VDAAVLISGKCELILAYGSLGAALLGIGSGQQEVYSGLYLGRSSGALREIRSCFDVVKIGSQDFGHEEV